MIIEKVLDNLVEEYYPYYQNGSFIPVHTLIYCREKYFIERRLFRENPKLLKKIMKEKFQVPKVFIGAIFHKGLEHYTGPIYTFIKTVSDMDKTYIISGRPDYVDFENKVVYEFKFAFSNEHEHYIKQLYLYMWLTGFSKGILIYFNRSGYGVKQYEKDVDDYYALKIIYEWKSPLYEWECRLCPFKGICDVYKRNTGVGREK